MIFLNQLLVAITTTPMSFLLWHMQYPPKANFMFSTVQARKPNLSSWPKKRKYEKGSSTAKVASCETDIEGSHANGFCDLNWFSSGIDMKE
ncbi:unnamed protein product [Sphenostylis stenocarpa]|uniref:Uncharacterized protein n=1 Tax=Sphenostylis stenocarpa TaxID=92480 RepID=A0AA86SRP6_9FABA|nr:unnamed protein product [Sphenostylis stenocarpa]